MGSWSVRVTDAGAPRGHHPGVSTLTSIRPSVVGTPHRHVGPDVEDEAPRTIQIPRTAARLDGYVRALTIGSGAFMTVGLIAAQILGTG